ncbi:MAG: excinuclease ABC subunit UvrA [Planctomycetes bacterium]|nr:excinuclease ABC subunit UvrA [Planctomycetota bacterium]
MASEKCISIRCAREHNLKSINVDIPRDKMVVITGLSGSGKSSLAFDTIYAEGQRRYVESLSAYARQFLEQMQKPDVEYIEGLPPTIAIEQRSAGSNPRSTVATTTEIYDYLRLLFARVGDPYCYQCGRPIQQQSPEQIVDAALHIPEETRVMILAPLVRGRKGEHRDALAQIKRDGFVRARVDGVVHGLTRIPDLEKNKKHTIEAVVDRLVIRTGIDSRLNDSIELALKLGQGIMMISKERKNGWEDEVFSELYACPDCGISYEELAPRTFSFNSPYGACPACDGLGTKMEFDPELIVPDKTLTLADGAIEAWRRGGKRMSIYYHYEIREFCRLFDVDRNTPFAMLPEDIQRILLYGTTREDEEKHQAEFEGVVPNLTRRFNKTTSEFVKHRLHSYMSEQPCLKCKGARLKPEALAVRVGGKAINEVTVMSIAEAEEFFANLKLSKERTIIAHQILKEIRARLGFMANVGLSYLTLDRVSATLSGGEAQRIRLATQVGSGLVGVCYVLDEPTIGLHQRDNEKLINTLKRMRDIGNTVIVVEHDEQTIRSADRVLDLGPGAGAHGGTIVAQGDIDAIIAEPKSLTGQYLSREQEIAIPEKRRRVYRSNCIQIKGAKENNLKRINVRFPTGVFCCVTGVSGSGKSTLVTQTLLRALRRKIYGSHDKPGKFDKLVGAQRVDKVIEIDQSPIGRTPRSNPATYIGVFDHIRKIFSQVREAKIRGYSAGRFSFNVKGGRCEACQGQGTKKIEMHFLPDIFVTCEQCKGLRYNRETLEIRYRGMNIADVLDMRIEEAYRFFENFPKVKKLLGTINDVGLGYMKLGQSSTTLSGGEAQRVKLASELGRSDTGDTLYILDEPTTGLHFADIKKLLDVLNRLTDHGNTVLVIEHNLDVIKTADYIIDLGPEGGEDGGRVIATGSPEEVAQNPDSYTGQYLAPLLGVKKTKRRRKAKRA